MDTTQAIQALGANTASPRAENVSRRRELAACWLLFAVLFIWLYAHIVRDLLDDWWNDPDYSYGLAVPFVIAYALYVRWDRVRRVPHRPAYVLGAAVLLLSQLSGLLGYFGAEFFLQRTSIVLLLCGLLLVLYGTQMLWTAAFPLLLLQLSIPLPSLIMTRMALPLQLLSSAAAEQILHFFGVPVFRSGNLLQMTQQTLNVGEACSGIRSLISLVTLAVVLAGFSRLRWPARILLVISAAPVAIVANAFRVSGAGLLSYYGSPSLTTGVWHFIEGWLVFLVAFLLLSVEMHLLGKLGTREAGQ